MLEYRIFVPKLVPSRKTAVGLLCALGLGLVFVCYWLKFPLGSASVRLVQDRLFGFPIRKRVHKVSMHNSVGGKKVNRRDFAKSTFDGDFFLPYKSFASLRTSNNEHICGASLIAPQIVLTAAHCFDLNIVDSPPVSADVGRLKRDGNAGATFSTRKIRKTIVHENYAYENSLDYDIALVLLDSPVSSPLVTLATTADCFESLEGCRLQILGFGKLDYNKNMADRLQIVSPPALSKENCQSYRTGQTITSNMLCAGNITHGGISSCKGDSGGPVFALQDGRYKQVGIVSWSNGCGDAYTPEVFSSVPTLLPWIEENLTKQS